MVNKFTFPNRGFHSVAEKVAETDYFLQKMKDCAQDIEEFGFLFSAFVSAARSTTFCLQTTMSGYPKFDEWYSPRQLRLKESSLATFFVELRNHIQKVGSPPLFYSGSSRDGVLEWTSEFLPTPDLQNVPAGDVVELSEAYFRLLLEILRECYIDYQAYIDPRATFTKEGLAELGWSIEDLEESLGFARGWTDIPWPDDDKDTQRLKELSRHGGDELMDVFFEKYEIKEAQSHGH